MLVLTAVLLVPVAEARWALLAVLVCGAMVGALGVLTLRASRALQARQTRLEKLVTENHKRASVWNYHLTHGLGLGTPPALEAKAAGTVDIVPADKPQVVVKRHPDARRLVDSGIFDSEYYAALVGSEFDTETEAASHYLQVNAPRGVSPSPFLAADVLPEHVRTELAAGNVRPLLAHLRLPEVFEKELGPLFTPSLSGVTPSASRRHPGGVLGAHLEAVGSETVLPVPVGVPAAGSRVGEVRDALVAHARSVHRSERLAGPRTTDRWDVETENSWLATLYSTPANELPLVTVVMPVKDRADVVGRTIRSVQEQTHRHWELLVVDDASTDDTRARVSSLASHDVRIRLLDGPGNGVSSARNRALREASGEYVAFLDSDNEWTDNFLETMLRAMVRDELGAAYSGVAIHGESLQYRAFDGGLDHLRILNHIDLNVLVVRSDVVAEAGSFDESLRRWVDHDFAIKIASVAGPTLLPFIGCEYEHSDERADRITVRESEHWQWVVLGKHWVDWREAPATMPGRLTVVVPTYRDSAMTVSAVRSVLKHADAEGVDVEVVIIDNGSSMAVGQAILANLGVSDRVRYRRLPRNLNFAIGCNIGAAMATGELVLFLNNDTEVRSGALTALVERMQDPRVLGVQPLLVYGDETIQTAGTVFTVRDGLPNHLLAGHPPADALPLAGSGFHALSAAALVMRSAHVRSLQGFDPIYVNGMEDVDLCLRAGDAYDGSFELVPTALVTHLESKTPGRGANVLENRRIFLDRWRGRLPEVDRDLFRSAGFTVAATGTDGRDVPGPKPLVVRALEDSTTRWGIKIGSIPGARGDMWGDTHFAESLRTALERAGQRAVVHRHGAHQTPAAAFDDVNLVVRGIDRVRPMPGMVNVLWVISHPDAVTPEEVREFDLVFAASTTWSAKMSEQAGHEVFPLLQATDTARFNVDIPPVPHDVPLFVGGIHPGRERRIVSSAVAAGVPIGVYGPGWDGLLPDGVLLGEYVDNRDLAGYYRGTPRVLADHWDLMAAEGFVQNRIFDAVACGSRVISDQVDGIDELFSGAVKSYRSPDDLALLCRDDARGVFPGDAQMESIAARVRRLHSFDRRAEQLVEAVAEFRKRSETPMTRFAAVGAPGQR